MELSMYIDAIENKLRGSFDISKNHIINGCSYELFAKYHLRNEKYILVKKAVAYAFENNEYVLLKYFKDFDKNTYHNCTDNLIKSVNSIVNPSNEHMSSTISGIIVTENIIEEDLEYIKNAVKQFRYNKGFAFGFKGWADIRLILVSLNEGLISANKKGKEVKEVYNF